ncbi:MAG TPA: hypothetical protein VIZ22_15100 [Candidatus Limnocylindrales bacterium]
MTVVRANRLFNAVSGNCINVAIDHGITGELELLGGIVDLPHAVDAVVGAHPDAVQLAVGSAHLLQERQGAQKPALVLRVDFANIYGNDIPDVRFCSIMEEAVVQAVRLDAAAVVCNLFDVADAPEIRQQCVHNILRLRADCSAYQMPLMVEPLVFRREKGGPYVSDGDVRRIVPLVRQAVELGADVIKADPTDDLDDYDQVIAVSTSPVLVRGGGRVTDEVVLRRTEQVMRAGARGIVYGRNIVQHPQPGAMVKALSSIVHGGGSADKALAMLGADGAS